MNVVESVTHRLEAAHSAATSACLAYATAVGLFEVLDRFRFRDASQPIPAPGTADLPDAIRAHALEAVHAAESCRILADDAMGQAGESAEVAATESSLDETLAAIDASLTRAEAAAAAAGRSLRHLAQVGLGVAQHATADDEVELVERSMIGVLSDDWSHAASDDRLPLGGRSKDELSVELAAVVARMLCDQSTGADPAPRVIVGGHGLADVRISITPSGGVDADAVGTFPPPVTITEVSALVLRYIGDLTGERFDDLELRWSPSPAEAGP
jgi:hypothetical protein